MKWSTRHINRFAPSLALPLLMISPQLLFIEEIPGSVYGLLAAAWLVVIVLTLRYRRNYQKKITPKLDKLSKEIEQLKNRLEFFSLHTDELKEEKIKKLHDELAQLDISLKAMEKTLQASYEASKRNSILLSNISHTLRTNLNDILGFSALLGTEFAMKEEEELFGYSENIRKSGESLLHLLNNIIDISRIEAKTFNLKPENCDLTRITKEIFTYYEPQANHKGIKIVYQDDEVPVFSGDGQSLRHILSNLVDNAIRYTNEGFIKVQQKFENRQLVWMIKDTGIGIDKAYLPDIFEPFRRQSLGYSKTTYQGAGLGLPLVKQLLELMGGSIELESQKAVGTTVTIYLPFKEPLIEKAPSKRKIPERKSSTPKPPSSLNKPLHRLLVVDHDTMNNMLIRKMLTNTEKIDFATNQHQLLQYLEKSIHDKSLYELIILETNFEVRKKAHLWIHKITQSFPEYKQIPIIALSSFPEMDKDEQSFIQLGFCAYVTKPLNKEKLFNSINRCFNL
jgi:signal transduction histidine kinase/CheY-like chemotaxis protein